MLACMLNLVEKLASIELITGVDCKVCKKNYRLATQHLCQRLSTEEFCKMEDAVSFINHNYHGKIFIFSLN